MAHEGRSVMRVRYSKNINARVTTRLELVTDHDQGIKVSTFVRRLFNPPPPMVESDNISPFTQGL